MDPAFLFNAAEAALWLVLSLTLLVVKDPSLTLRVRTLLVVSYALFGVSDLIEMQTGAWWRPLGLLVMKAICLTGIVTGMVMWGISRKRRVE